MKTEKEIREHRDALRTCRQMPCDCTGQHAIECAIGGKMMMASEDVLSWVLGDGESPNTAERVARINEDAAAYRAWRK